LVLQLGAITVGVTRVSSLGKQIGDVVQKTNAGCS
jgi:hypothetical protein